MNECIQILKELKEGNNFKKKKKKLIQEKINKTSKLLVTGKIYELYGIMTFIFCEFYSNSFDNYKIVEKIISNNTNLHTRIPSSFWEPGIGLVNNDIEIKPLSTM